MLRAFQKQLDAMAFADDGSFEWQVAQRWGRPVPSGLVEDLKEFVRLLPKIERKVYALYAWLPQESKVKNVGSHFLTYMYQPEDFLPESENIGLFAYLDDAYLAALFYELMLEEIQMSKQARVRKQDLELLKKVIRLRKKAKSVIPDEAIRIKEMLAGLFEGDDAIYRELFKEKVQVPA